MTVVLSQDAEELDLVWIEQDPVALAFAVAEDWSGVYTVQIRTRRSPTAPLVGVLAVAAVLADGVTTFTLTMSEEASALVLAGSYYWDLQQTGGVTRLGGRVIVKGQVTV